jgi:hypothetical protein
MEWFNPKDPPDFWLYSPPPRLGEGGRNVPVLEETIWTPCWLDAYPPIPCLCCAWGGMGDMSRMNDWMVHDDGI